MKMRMKGRFKILQGVILAALSLALLWPAGGPNSTTARATEVKKQTVELEVKQDSKKTVIKMFVEDGRVVKVTAKDGDDERTLQRVNRENPAKVTCERRDKKCEMVKLASGERLQVCVCPEVAPSELNVRLMTTSLAAGGNTSQPRHRLFALVDRSDPGGGGGGGCTETNPCCYEDHKLQMSVCYP